MWNLILLPALLFGGSLYEFSKPYLSLYTCECMTLGEKNLLDDFDKITIELKEDGYCYRAVSQGEIFEREGTFVYDPEAKQIIFDGNLYGTIDRGELSFGMQLGDRYFWANFLRRG
ncbi:MAG: hypothetical protein J6D37_03955 [Clostridia bacterium]|nr:hypothetical protein [Clostridia bacterium]